MRFLYFPIPFELLHPQEHMSDYLDVISTRIYFWKPVCLKGQTVYPIYTIFGGQTRKILSIAEYQKPPSYQNVIIACSFQRTIGHHWGAISTRWRFLKSIYQTINYDKLRFNASLFIINIEILPTVHNAVAPEKWQQIRYYLNYKMLSQYILHYIMYLYPKFRCKQ